jgi:hypothetical protein
MPLSLPPWALPQASCKAGLPSCPLMCDPFAVVISFVVIVEKMGNRKKKEREKRFLSQIE